MSELTNLSLSKARLLLDKREISSEELVLAHLKRIDEQDVKLNAFTLVTRDLALKQAKFSDEKLKRSKGEILEGIPIGVKDLFCTKGIRTTACSKILQDFIPGYESTVTANLFQRGAVMIGKTNMDEFAMGSSNENSFFGNVINPWTSNDAPNKKLVPGGSSGGSAAAVAAKMCIGSLGSDTGGSVRQPASFCGIVGIKPTYGRCSRYGMIAFASSLDQAGVFARTVHDSAMILQAITGYDKKDSTSKNIAVPNFSSQIGDSISGLRVGIPKDYMIDGISKDVIEAWKKSEHILEKAGAIIKYIELPHTKYALSVYYIIAPAQAASNLARYDGIRYGFCSSASTSKSFYEMVKETRTEGFGKEVKRRIMIGNYILSSENYSSYYIKAMKIRRLVANDFYQAFKNDVDVILAPTSPSSAFGIGEKINDPVAMYLSDIFTIPASLAGLPGISVPISLTNNGLPLGIQLFSNLYDEVNLFKAASILEKESGFNSSL